MNYRTLFALGFAQAAALLPAQTAASSASSPPSTLPVIELSPFTVVSDRNTGYRAQNTRAGSRLNSSLKDTPGVLDVLTKDFLDDIGATTLQEALAFSTNFADDLGDFDSQGVINTIFPGAQINVNFRSRGLGGTMARNYLETDSRPAFYTVERIDNSSDPQRHPLRPRQRRRRRQHHDETRQAQPLCLRPRSAFRQQLHPARRPRRQPGPRSRETRPAPQCHRQPWQKIPRELHRQHRRLLHPHPTRVDAHEQVRFLSRHRHDSFAASHARGVDLRRRVVKPGFVTHENRRRPPGFRPRRSRHP